MTLEKLFLSGFNSRLMHWSYIHRDSHCPIINYIIRSSNQIRYWDIPDLGGRNTSPQLMSEACCDMGSTQATPRLKSPDPTFGSLWLEFGYF